MVVSLNFRIWKLNSLELLMIDFIFEGSTSVGYQPTKFKFDQSKRPKNSWPSLDLTVFMVFSQTLIMTRADWLMIRPVKNMGHARKKRWARQDYSKKLNFWVLCVIKAIFAKMAFRWIRKFLSHTFSSTFSCTWCYSHTWSQYYSHASSRCSLCTKKLI